MDRVVILLVVLAVTAAFSAWWRSRDGRVIGARAMAAAGTSPWSGLPVEAADVVARLQPTTPLALVEFTAPDCAPCVPTWALLEEVAADRDDLSVHRIDVGDAMDLVRAHRIMRAPTTLLVTADGHLLGRVSGLPRRQELLSLLDGTRLTQTP